ncbi:MULTISPECIES: hypothetical protein [Streptacidiphilus]|uniref:Uncharacterized protein n=1 Tax=Streptacidiphilus cavernicola TaxID=3342716 RepID=A0ABV6UEQ5_9ACTN|nr:hypothetical protein [Streptacidiphilus jeojiense]
MTTIDLTNTDETPTAPAATPNDEQQSDVLSGVRDDLLKYSAQGGFTLTAETHAWYAAVGTVATPEDARAASTILAELRGRDLATVREAAELLDSSTPLSGLDTVAAVAEAVALLLRVRETLATLTPAAYRSADLDRLSAATASGADRKAQGVKLSWGDRRALAKAARRLAVSKRTRKATLHSAINAASAERADWAALAPDTLPALPEDAAVLDSAPSVDTVRTGLAVLGQLLPDSSDLAALPFAELAELVDRLAADEGTLYRLPTLRALRDSIEERGHGELLAELTEQQADADAVTAACDRHFGPAATETAEAEAAEAEAADAEVVTTTVTTTATATDLLPAPRATDDATEVETEDTTEVAEVEAVEAEVEVAEVEAVVEAETEVEVEVEAEPVVEAEAEPVAEVEAEPVAAAVEAEDAPVEAEVAEPAEAPAAEAEAPEAVAAEAETPAAEGAAVEAPAPETETAPEVEPVAEAEPTAVAAEPEAVEPAATPEPDAVEPAVKRPRKPSFTPGRPVTAYSADELVSVVRWIDGDGTARTEDELLRAAMKELGFSRLGPRIKEALGAAITAARA